MDLSSKNGAFYAAVNQTSSISLSHVCLILFVLLVLVFALFTVWKRYLTSSVRHALREEVMLEVRSQMADYAQLDDGEGSNVNVREMKKFTF